MTAEPHIDLADVRAALKAAYNKGAKDEGRGYEDVEADVISLAATLAAKLAADKNTIKGAA